MPAARPVAKARISKLLVVDASVMRAAGGEAVTAPVPAHTRDTFKAILALCHRVCLSPDLSEEWKHHQSRFANLWLTKMYARRKVVLCEPPSCRHLVDDIRSFHLTTELDIAAVEKDIHLVAAALTTAHRTILSWDTHVVRAIRKVCADTKIITSKAIAPMLWINPIADHDSVQAWLSETGPAQPHWPLGVSSVPHPVAPRPRGRSMQRGRKRSSAVLDKILRVLLGTHPELPIGLSKRLAYTLAIYVPKNASSLSP
jgi:hypothetical protein